MAHHSNNSATCLPLQSFFAFLHPLNKDREEEQEREEMIEGGQIDDSFSTQQQMVSFESFHNRTTASATDITPSPSLPLPPVTVRRERGSSNLTNNKISQKEVVVKKIYRGSNMSSSMNQVTITLLLLISLSIPFSCGLELKPPTAEKEVFTGDSFVVTCLTESPSSPDLKLSWLAPDGREVASVPTAPIYVSEKPDGLQIVFLRHAKKHSGKYMCVQRRVSILFTRNFLHFNEFVTFSNEVYSTSFLLFLPSFVFIACHSTLAFTLTRPPTCPTPFALCPLTSSIKTWSVPFAASYC